ncbi:hypothetical protein GM418_29080 [Maribellus comscasis]|uniref:Uncharacterized protein n=1 Tax=Maribellus comscasis TaxID=2681766 RepID=A0A6I6JWS1_9BACT|nr:hypothetical protein [Maribellus comscasis]QGY47576.1 hypothetical protein GM418_29080 [Maribellus comscasis]
MTLISYDNSIAYQRKPKLSYFQTIAFAITSESLGIGCKGFFRAKIKNEHVDDFPKQNDRSNFNQRRRRLYCYIETN